MKNKIILIRCFIILMVFCWQAKGEPTTGLDEWLTENKCTETSSTKKIKCDLILRCISDNQSIEISGILIQSDNHFCFTPNQDQKLLFEFSAPRVGEKVKLVFNAGTMSMTHISTLRQPLTQGILFNKEDD